MPVEIILLNLFIIKNIMETFVQILASVISAVVCYKMAENRKRNPVIGAVCGFFLPIISGTNTRRINTILIPMIIYILGGFLIRSDA